MASADGSLHEGVRSIVDVWKLQRVEHQLRRHLEQADFDVLRDVGLLRAVVPSSMGGYWRDTASSARMVCELLRLIA